MAYIIAEIGFNHEGDLDAAEQMIRKAAEAGADAVKFQSFRAEDIALPGSEHFKAIRDAEMSEDMHRKLQQCATAAEIDFLSTPFGLWAVDLLESMGVPAFKVASMDCTNHVLLDRLAATGKPIYLSTGMSTLEEIRESLAFLKKQDSGPVTVLHCMSKYPPEANELNLAVIPRLTNELGVPVGYSDHFPGIEAAVTAVALGATIIETHFTLDTKKQGGDHGHSVDPAMLAELVRRAKEVDAMRGTDNLTESRPDRELAQMFRRGLHAGRNMKKGHVFAEGDITACRPGAHFGPNDLEELHGAQAAHDITAGEALNPDNTQI